MALFGIGKKQEQGPAPSTQSQQDAQERSIVQEIGRMQQQGMQNSQIVQQLQRQGYKTYQIFDAFNTIDLAGKGGPIDQPIPPDPSMMAPQPGQDPYLPPPDQMPQGMQSQQQGGMMPAPPSQMAMQQMQMMDPSQQYEELDQAPEQDEQLEELVEAIVEEKWEDLVRNVNKIITWKNVMENRLSVLEQRFTDLKMQFDDLNKGVLDKMAEYDQNIVNVGTEIKAMEQIFQKILPTFTENINELSRLTKQMKQVQPVVKK